MLIDLILALIIVAFAIIFFRKGIFGVTVGILRILLSILASVTLGKALSVFIFKGFGSQITGGASGEILSLIISYFILFLVFFALSSLILRGFKREKFPIIGFVDKLGGLLIGLAIGIMVATLISSFIYGTIEILSGVTRNREMLSIYEESRLFKLIIDVNLFDLIENSLFLKR